MYSNVIILIGMVFVLTTAYFWFLSLQRKEELADAQKLNEELMERIQELKDYIKTNGLV